MKENINNQENQYEEISLKEIIQVLIDKKLLIGTITLICIVVGILLSFVVLKPKYSTTTTISVTPTIASSDISNNVEDLLESFSKLPVMTVESYKEQVKSHEVLEKVIRELDLKNESGEYISTSLLSSKISVSIIKGTNLINITTTDSDTEMAAKISNSISENFIEFISEQTRARGLKSAELIEAQLSIEEKNLNEKSKALTDYISNNQSIDELTAQKNSLISQITSYRSELNNVEKNIMTQTASLEVLLGEDYSKVYKDIDLSMSIDGQLSKNIKLDISDSSGLQDSLLVAKITDIEISLVQNLANEKSLVLKINDMEEKLKTAQTDLAEQEHLYKSILRDFNLAKTAYDAYQNRHKQAMITAASDIGQTSVVISSYAVAQNNPISPNKKMILAISLILGLMIGVFVALFSDYWKRV